MVGKERRKIIVEKLRETNKGIKGSEFAKTLGVSRQVIVQDIALLRAEGVELIGSPGGYKLKGKPEGLLKTISTRHTSDEEMRKELEIILDNGGKIRNIIVEHEIYGEIRANLHINNYEDLEEFMGKIAGAEPLSSITEGVHLHTVEVKDEESYEKIKEQLSRVNLLNEA